jgi:mRNA interferase RelE/StbE
LTWEVVYKRTFLKDLARLPSHVRERVKEIAFGEEFKEDPFLKGKVQKMEGFTHFYKIRFGDYRVGLRIDAESKEIEFRRVLHRREIYRKFP